jgi:Zonular occludens toxin (Zot)
MIEVIEGRGVGSGKTYFAVERLFDHWIRGGTAFVSETVRIDWSKIKALALKRHQLVLEDNQYRVVGEAGFVTLHEHTGGGTDDLPVVIVLDEAQGSFNARDWNDEKKRPFFSWLCQSRHDDNDVWIISQSAANVDKQIRRLATFIWVIRNSENFPLFGLSLGHWMRWMTFGLSKGQFFIRTQLDQDGHTKLQRKWAAGDWGLFGCYQSKAMRLKHRRGCEAIARCRLAKVKKKGLGIVWQGLSWSCLSFLAALLVGKWLM